MIDDSQPKKHVYLGQLWDANAANAARIHPQLLEHQQKLNVDGGSRFCWSVPIMRREPDVAKQSFYDNQGIP